MINLNKDNRPNQTLIVELPADLFDHAQDQAKKRGEETSAYIRRLILIDYLEDELEILKYKPMIDRF